MINLRRLTVRRATRTRRRSPRRGFMLWIVAAVAGDGAVGGWWWWTRDDGGKRGRQHRPARGRPRGLRARRHRARRDRVGRRHRRRLRGEDQEHARRDASCKIVPEGTVVKKGDFLVELDASAFKEERNTQQILVNTAEALVVAVAQRVRDGADRQGGVPRRHLRPGAADDRERQSSSPRRISTGRRSTTSTARSWPRRATSTSLQLEADSSPSRRR